MARVQGTRWVACHSFGGADRLIRTELWWLKGAARRQGYNRTRTLLSLVDAWVMCVEPYRLKV
jgi:hypothetical protein